MFFTAGPIISRVFKDDLVKAKQVVPATVIQKGTGLKISDNIDDYADIMKVLYSSSKRVDTIVGDVVSEATLGHKCIVLTTTIKYGQLIAERINSLGLSADMVFSAEIINDPKTSKTKAKMMPKKKRLGIIQDFIEGKLDVLVATYRLLAEGFDHKPLDRLFLAAPISPKNHTLLEQTCGRVERTSPGKEDAVVYDYVDNHSMMLTQAKKRAVVYEANSMRVILAYPKT
jgi:superfamily II DNA or RNA helicase